MTKDMKFFLLKNEEASYIQDRTILVRAENEEQARKLAFENDDGFNEVFLNPKKTTCEEVTLEGQPKVIIADNVGA